MLRTKLCLVLLVFKIIGRGQGYSGNSSSPPSRRMSDEQAVALRRQLMQDNYDYALSDVKRKHPNVSEERDTAKIYYQKDGTDHLPETAELTQSDSAAEHAQYEQDGRLEQAGHYEPNPAQYERPSQYGHHGQREQYLQEQPDQYMKPKDFGRVWSEQEHLEHQGQFDEQDQAQYDEQTDRTKPSHADADELTVRDIQPQRPSEPRDTDLARRHMEPQMDREMAYNPPYHKKQSKAIDPYQAQPARSFSDLRGDFREQYGQYDAVGQPEQVNQAEKAEFNQEEQEAIDQQNISDSQDEGSDYSGSKSKEPSREMYNAFGHTTRARLQPYRRPSTARAPTYRGRDSLIYQDRNAPLGRDHYAQPGRNHHAPPHSHHAAPTRYYRARPGRTHHGPSGWSHYSLPGRIRHAPPGRNYPQASSGRNYQAPSYQDRNAPLDHNISKKDLLYYMDDTQLRRHNNEMSPDVPDEEELPSPPSPQPSAIPSSPTASPTSPRANPVTTKPLYLTSTERAHRSFVVTVSPSNVTYKLLTLKAREGRRRGERRILEERGPGGVAIISLDHAPLPAFRLPRSRRQYMHDHHHRRQPA